MSKQGRILLSGNAEIFWSINDGDSEYWAAVYVNNQVLTYKAKPIIGWWRTNDLDSLKSSVLSLYGSEIDAAIKRSAS